MLATHFDAERRYSKIRKEALAAAAEVIQSSGKTDLRLSEIDSKALSACKIWDFSQSRINQRLGLGRGIQCIAFSIP